jgi:hypothetical protein
MQKYPRGQTTFPAELWGAVCSFLDARASVRFLALVVRRTDVRVPWLQLDDSVTFSGVRRLAILPRLRVLQVVLSPGSFMHVKSVLYAAESLETLLLSHAEAALLVALVQDGVLTASALSLELEISEPSDNNRLATFVGAFPAVSTLALRLRKNRDFLVAELLDCVIRAAPHLRALEITGSIYAGESTLEAIAACPLDRLLLDIHCLGLLDVLGRLTSLSDLSVVTTDVSFLGFIKNLSSLRTLFLCLEERSEEIIRLPCSLRELRCFSWHPDLDRIAIQFGVDIEIEPDALRVVELPVWVLLGLFERNVLGQVETLACHVAPSDVAGLQRLVAGLPQLRCLELTQVGPRNTLSHLADRDSDAVAVAIAPLSPGVTSIELRDVDPDEDLAWLGMFPDLTELRLKFLRGSGSVTDSALVPDSVLVQVFRACPKLMSLADRSVSLTVGRNPAGRLVKRVRDLCTILEL